MDISSEIYQSLRYRIPGHRHCSVYGCNNSGQRLTAWLKDKCPQHDCSRDLYKCTCVPPYIMFPFPTEKQNNATRQIWIKNVNRRDQADKHKIWQPNVDSRVCSKHFIDAQPTIQNPYPTLSMGHHLNPAMKKRKSPLKRLPLPAPKKVKSKFERDRTIEDGTPCCSTAASVSATFLECSPPQRDNECPMDHDYCDVPENAGIESNCNLCLNLGQKVKSLKQQVSKLQNDVRFYKSKLYEIQTQPFGEKRVQSDSKIRFYTGLPSRAIFDGLFHELSPKVTKLRYWRGSKHIVSTKAQRKFVRTPKKFGRKRALPAKDEFLMTLMKIRLGLLNHSP